MFRPFLFIGMVLALTAFAPAQSIDVSGNWIFHVTTDAGTGDPEFTLRQNDGKITGKYKGMLGEADVKGTIEGAQITLEFVVSMGEGATIVYKGTVESPEKMKGTVDLAGQASGTWVGEKKK